MKKANNLVEMREQLGEKIKTGTYELFTGELLSRMTRLFRLSHRPEFPVEKSALCLILCHMVWAGVILFQFEPKGQAKSDFVTYLPLTLILYISVVGTQKYWKRSMDVLSSHLLHSINDPENITDLERWLYQWTNHRLEMVWSALFVIVFDTAFILASYLTGEFVPNPAAAIAFLPMFLQIGMLFYSFAWAISLPLRIQHYQFKLYGVDPASSEIIVRLASLFTSFIFLIAGIAGVLTLLITILNPLPIFSSLFVIGLGWFPLITAFIVTQGVLRHIISHAKQILLNQIQASIGKLQTRNAIPSDATLRHIRALVDYHDYIKSRRSSTLDLQTGVNFLNSLLFPVLGILVGNLKELADFFSR